MSSFIPPWLQWSWSITLFRSLKKTPRTSSLLRNLRGIFLRVCSCWSPTWSESRLPLLSPCCAPSVHWLSMSSAVIWTDWASQLSNRELSSGNDFDKPEKGGKGRERGVDRSVEKRRLMADIRTADEQRGETGGCGRGSVAMNGRRHGWGEEAQRRGSKREWLNAH